MLFGLVEVCEVCIVQLHVAWVSDRDCGGF